MYFIRGDAVFVHGIPRIATDLRRTAFSDIHHVIAIRTEEEFVAYNKSCVGSRCSIITLTIYIIL